MCIDFSRFSIDSLTRHKWLSGGPLILLLVGSYSFASDAHKIMDAAIEVRRTEMSANSKMLLFDSKGVQRERKIVSMAKKFPDGWKTYLRFEFPPDVAGTQFLVLEKPGPVEDDMFLFQPINKRSRRITSTQRSGRFMGTDYFYEDLDLRDLESDDHKLLREEKLTLSAGKSSETVDTYVIESTPREAAPSSYSKFITWVSKSNSFSRQKEFYVKGKLTKRMRVFAVKKDGNRWIPILVQMDDLVDGSKTIISTDVYSLDRSKMSDETFTEGHLLIAG